MELKVAGIDRSGDGGRRRSTAVRDDDESADHPDISIHSPPHADISIHSPPDVRMVDLAFIDKKPGHSDELGDHIGDGRRNSDVGDAIDIIDEGGEDTVIY